ncbi:glycosyltransferase [Paenibacillus sp. 32O-W]|uniref:glycosyltransferase n=1 Tax=Paenibacillus sp. 32O-W TaxID=1695218 RepID=UPI0011A08372|nr:glycosyltransferase [Paenibacillus sp. 32O-W]
MSIDLIDLIKKVPWWVPSEDIDIRLIDAVNNASAKICTSTHSPRDNFVFLLQLNDENSINSRVFLELIDYLFEVKRACAENYKLLLFAKQPIVNSSVLKYKFDSFFDVLADQFSLGKPEIIILDDYMECGVIIRDACDLLRTMNGKLVPNKFLDAILRIVLLRLGSEIVYLGGGYLPSDLLRHSELLFIGVFHITKWEEPFTTCPEYAKLPPAGACAKSSILFALEKDDLLTCKCKSKNESVESSIRLLWKLFLEIRRVLIKKKTDKFKFFIKPKVNFHSTKFQKYKEKQYAVMLFGSPSISISNIALCSLTSSLSKDGKGVLLVEDEISRKLYKNYDVPAVKKMYHDLADLFDLQVTFTSERENFATSIVKWLENLKVSDVIRAIPYGRTNRSRGTITVYDAIHLATMAATLEEYPEHSLVLHAKNVAALNAFLKPLRVPGYIACHNFFDSGVRLAPYDDIRKSLSKQLVEKMDYKTEQLIKVAKLDEKINIPYVDSIIGEKLKTLEIDEFAGEVFQIPDYILRSTTTSNNDFYLSVDDIGTNVSGLKYGGPRLKILQVGTNIFVEHLRQKIINNISTSDIVVCANNYIYEFIINQINLRENIFVVPIGVDETYMNKPYTHFIPNRIIAYGPNIRQDSGIIKDLINSSKYLYHKEYIHELIIVDTNKKSKERYQNNISNHIKLIKTNSLEELELLQSGQILYCLSNLDSGVSYKKAGLLHRVVIASQGGTADEFVNNGKNGIIFGGEGWYNLAFTLAYLLTRPDECDRMGKNGHNSFCDSNWEKYYEEIVRIAESFSSSLNV